MGTVFVGGQVVSPQGACRADLRVEGERIDAVGFGLLRRGDETVDVAGQLLLPGGVDGHTHFDLPAGEFRTADDFASGTRAALAGGTTTVVDYATQFRGQTLAQGVEAWHALAEGRAFCDYGFHLAVTDWNEGVGREVPAVVEGGIPSFKMYMAYKGALQVDDGVLLRMARVLAPLGGLLCVHCENGDLVAALQEDLFARGERGPRAHPLSRPAEAEAESVHRMTVLAELAGAPLLVVHVSAARSLEVLRAARSRGGRVFAETCPQYLLLDEGRYLLPPEEARKFVLSPPLRTREDQSALWEALDRGEVDTVATDHCSFHARGQKDRGAEDFRRIPSGLPGVEHRMELLYSAGVAEGRLSLGRYVEALCARPARLFGLYPRKGVLAPGSDADLVVLDPLGSRILRASEQVQRVDYCPYEGMEVRGRIEQVYLRGRRVVHRGRLLEGPPGGVYLRRRPFEGRN